VLRKGVRIMTRTCSTCQHIKRADIDRRLAAGEPGAQVARDYDVSSSSLHRHRTNCLKLPSSNIVMKDTARGTAAVALLPSQDTLAGSYLELRNQIDQIVVEAKQQGSLPLALKGLNAVRHTLDSLARLAGHDRVQGTQINVAVQTNVDLGAARIAERLIEHFDHEPEIKARIAQALLAIDATPTAQVTSDAHAVSATQITPRTQAARETDSTPATEVSHEPVA
jgi:hypothetical protein